MADPAAALEYERASALLSALTDVRFKLLAFTPTIAGTAIAVLGRAGGPSALLGVGLLGLVATAGIVLYEVHNTELYEHVLRRTEELERRLGLQLMLDRPHHRHDRPLALVYAAALGGWAYLAAWGALAAAAVADARSLGGAAGAVVAVLGGATLLRQGAGRGGEPVPAGSPQAAVR